jgi:hypothetical protein
MNGKNQKINKIQKYIKYYGQNKHIQQIHLDSRRPAAVRCAVCAEQRLKAAAAYI